MELQSVPTEIDVLQRRLLQLQLAERMLAQRGGGARAGAARRGPGRDRSRSRSSSRTCAASGRWRSPGLGDIQKVRERLEAVKAEYSRAWDEIRQMQQRGERPEEKRFQALAALDAERKALEKRIAEAEAHGRRPPTKGAAIGCSRRRSTPRRSPRSSASGPASPSPDAHHRAREAPEARGPDPPPDGEPGGGGPRRGRRRPTQPGRACRTRTGRSARSCSWGRPASARPSWPRPWPSSSSTARRPWSGWT